MKFANPLLGVNGTDPFNEMFEVVIQLAAILAVVILYAKKFFDFKRIGFYIKLIIAVIPALVVGALLKKHIDGALGNLTFVACVMIGGGIVLLFVDKFFTRQTVVTEEQITNKNAFVIGCFQPISGSGLCQSGQSRSRFRLSQPSSIWSETPSAGDQ